MDNKERIELYKALTKECPKELYWRHLYETLGPEAMKQKYTVKLETLEGDERFPNTNVLKIGDPDDQFIWMKPENDFKATYIALDVKDILEKYGFQLVHKKDVDKFMQKGDEQ